MPGANDHDQVSSDSTAARDEAEGDSEDEAVWAAELGRRNEGDGNGNPQHRKPVDE